MVDPYKFLDGVVEVHADIKGRCRGRCSNGFIAGELKLFNEVFVRVLGETAAFIGVKVDVINVELAITKTNRWGSSSLCSRIIINITIHGCYVNKKIGKITEFHVDLNFVVLKSDQGKGKTGVAVEPELEGYEEGCFFITKIVCV